MIENEMIAWHDNFRDSKQEGGDNMCLKSTGGKLNGDMGEISQTRGKRGKSITEEIKGVNKRTRMA